MAKEKTMRGTSLRIFLTDGTAEGPRVVEKANWTGQAIMCSRSEYPDVRNRDEFAKPGVYALIGVSDEGANRQQIYIGEADQARARLNQQAKDKDFWTHLILFSSKDDNLNKAHVKYIESRLIGIAKSAKRAKVENGNAPEPPALSEPDRDDMETFLDQMLLIYPLLGVTAFESAVSARPREGNRLYLSSKGGDAEGQETSDGFVVYAGSKAAAGEVPSCAGWVKELREVLLSEGVLAPNGSCLVFKEDYLFNSPSAAAAALSGRNINGRDAWKSEDGKSLKQLQEAALGGE